MSAVSRRDSRAILIGVLIVAPVIAWRTLIMPYASWLDTERARAESAAELYSREQALVQDGARLPAALAAARHRLTLASARTFRGTDTATVTAALATWCRDAARAAGLTDIRVEPAAADAEAGRLIAPRVDVYATGTTPALAAWLARLEAGDRVVSVLRLDLSADDVGLLMVHAHVRSIATGGTP